MKNRDGHVLRVYQRAHPDEFPDESLRDLAVSALRVYALRHQNVEDFLRDVRTFGRSAWDQRGRSYSLSPFCIWPNDQRKLVSAGSVGIERENIQTGQDDDQMFPMRDLYREARTGAKQLPLF